MGGTTMVKGLRPVHRVALAAAIATGTIMVATGIGNAASASGAWSTPTIVDSGGVLTSVSCPTVKFCIAVDGSGNAIVHKRNNTWAAPSPIDTGHGGLSSVSCATTQFCMAVDGAGNEKRYVGGKWSTVVDIDASVALAAVSC